MGIAKLQIASELLVDLLMLPPGTELTERVITVYVSHPDINADTVIPTFHRFEDGHAEFIAWNQTVTV